MSKFSAHNDFVTIKTFFLFLRHLSLSSFRTYRTTQMDQERSILFEAAVTIVFDQVAAMTEFSDKEKCRASFYRMMSLGMCYDRLPKCLSEHDNFKQFRDEATTWMRQWVCQSYKFLPVEFGQLVSFIYGVEVSIFKENKEGIFVEAFRFYPETYQPTHEGIILQPTSPTTYFHLSQP